MSKRFGVEITDPAHAKMRELSEKYGVGQNYILSAVLVAADLDDPALEGFINEAVRLKEQDKLREDARKATAGMSAEERKAFFASLEGDAA